MADPTQTQRQTPVGIAYKTGFPTKIAFAADPDVSFWEKTVKPPSFDGGDPIDTTNMHRTTYRTKAPRALVELGEVNATVTYDESVFQQILNLINVNGAITVHFPDGSTLSFYGYLRSFDPQEMSEDEPTANITIVPTNWDPVNNVEAGPVFTTVPGT